MIYIEPCPSLVSRWRIKPPSTQVRDSRGPERVEVGETDPSFVRRSVGFTADLIPEVEPLVWEGDSA